MSDSEYALPLVLNSWTVRLSSLVVIKSVMATSGSYCQMLWMR